MDPCMIMMVQVFLHACAVVGTATVLRSVMDPSEFAKIERYLVMWYDANILASLFYVVLSVCCPPRHERRRVDIYMFAAVDASHVTGG